MLSNRMASLMRKPASSSAYWRTATRGYYERTGQAQLEHIRPSLSETRRVRIRLKFAYLTSGLTDADNDIQDI